MYVMGAQPTKSDDELTIVHSGKQQCGTFASEPNHGQELLNETHIQEAVMSKQNLTSVANPKRITVANFAKIKTEPPAEEEYSNELPGFEENETNIVVKAQQAEKQRKKSNPDIEIQKDQLVSKGNQNISLKLSSNEVSGITIVAEENYLVLNSLSTAHTLQNISNIEVKKELLESHGIASASKKCNETDVVFKNSSVPISTDKLTGANSDNFPKAVKNESIEDYSINEQFRNENIVLPATDDIKFSKEVIKKENSSDKVEEDIIQQQEIYKLVKNPFFRKTSNEKKYLKQRQPFKDKVDDYFENKSIKSDVIHCNEELNIGQPLKTSTPTENLSSVKPVLDEEMPLSAINLNELIIKSETQAKPDDNLDFHVNSNLGNNCLSCNLNSSLDVNLSNVDDDFVEALSTRPIKDDVSNISINSSRDSLQYYSTIEISSVENDDLPVKEPTIVLKHKAQEKQKPDKSRYKRRPYKTRQKGKFQNSNNAKVQKKSDKKPVSKTLKSRKYSRRDYLQYVSKKTLKNLPKTCIQTRQKGKNTLETKNDFPKPFKLEPQFVQNELDIATELPKPMMFKREAEINVKNMKAYLKPEFQPYVRLQRLKSEELLAPLKRKSRQPLSFHQMSSDSRRDFLIKHAFSLNQRIKLNRLSIDHDQLHYHNNNEQPSLYSRLTTPCSLSKDTPNESLAEADSKYFSAQELYSLFHSSTPSGSSMQSRRLDSGVSTSTPSMQQSHTDNNKTLLLEIAAERAFINNHLMHFGYSPMQFELFNNSNDLNVFLKYLLGSVNMN